MEDFQPWTWTHLIAVIACLLTAAVVIHWRRELGASPRGVTLDRAVSLFGFLTWLASAIWWALPQNFQLYGFAKSLPLQLCDFAAIVAPVAILTHKRWARALLYCWGVGLSTQAFVTPVVAVGPVSPSFWVFWLIHLAIVGSAAYDVFALGFRPSWRDFLFAVAGGLLYLALVLPVNLALDVNYGFVGKPPAGRPTIVDSLGPWPWRIGPIALLAALTMALAVLPWTVKRKRSSLLKPAASGIGGRNQERSEGIKAAATQADPLS